MVFNTKDCPHFQVGARDRMEPSRKINEPQHFYYNTNNNLLNKLNLKIIFLKKIHKKSKVKIDNNENTFKKLPKIDHGRNY